MIKEQTKRKILILKNEENLSIRQIYIQTGVARNTIAKVLEEANKKPRENVCKNCGAPLLRTNGHEKKFCCKKCSDQWWSQRRRLLGSHYYEAKKCAHCGKLFFPVNRRQKYCSRICYLDDVSNCGE